MSGVGSRLSFGSRFPSPMYEEFCVSHLSFLKSELPVTSLGGEDDMIWIFGVQSLS